MLSPQACTLISITKNNFYIRQAGIFAGQIKGIDFLPSHDLALSVYLKNDIPNIELDDDNIVFRYLRGESLSSQICRKRMAIGTL